MTARNMLSQVRLRACAAVWIRSSVSLCAACFVLLCVATARPAAAQSDTRPKWEPTRSGRTAWRQSRVHRGSDEARVAQTPAGPEYASDSYQYEGTPEYAGGMPYDGHETGGGYDYAVESTGPMEYEGGEFIDARPDDLGYYDDGYYDEGGYGGRGFDWHGFYVRADYLLWWSKGFGAPPLVTTSPEGTPREEAGILGLPTTSVLFPHGNLASTIQHGGRIRLGYWIDPYDTAAIEGTYFAFGNASTHFTASDAQIPILARPFVNIEENAVGNDAELVAFPGLFSGEISVLGTSRLQGAEVIFRHALCKGCDWRVDGLIGWRFNRLDETLVVSDSRTVLSGQTGLTVGTVLAEWDRFSTRNTFNGVQIGVITERRHCRWWFETRATLALGNNRSKTTIGGQQTAVVPLPGGGEQVTVTDAGLLAQETNIGRYADDNFAIVPQLGLNVGWEIAGGVWATLGYNFMYWSQIARPGDQIDTDVNLSQLSPGGLVGLARPQFPDRKSDYWAQGLNVGLAYRY